MGGYGVIVTDGNERSALAVTRALGSRGIPVYVGADTKASLAGSSRYCVRSFVYPSPWHDPDGYLASVLDAAIRFGVASLFPMTDIAMEIIGEHRSKFPSSIKLPIPRQEQYHQVSDKYHLTQWAQNAGIPTPKTVFVPHTLDDTTIETIEDWPVVIKPARSLIKVDGLWHKSTVLVAKDHDDLRRIYHESWFLRFPSMIQQMIVGHGEGIFGLFTEGRPAFLFAHRRLRERPPAGGVSVLREAIALPKPMTEYATRIMRDVAWDGVAMVEFKVESRSRIPYLMEVNGRFWGSLQLAIDAGLDFPTLLHSGLTGSREETSQPYSIGTRSHWWLGDLDHLLARLRDSKSESTLAPGSPPRWKVFVDLLNVFQSRNKNEVFRGSDLLPGLFELKEYVVSRTKAFNRKVRDRLRNKAQRIQYSIADLGLRTGLNRTILKRQTTRRTNQVLVLCKGNICRSPFAERYLFRASKLRGLNLKFVSAGLDAEPGRRAYPMALRVAPDFGIDLDNHLTQLVTEEMVESSDAVLVMEPSQKRQLEGRFASAAPKTFLLGHFSPSRPVTVITDPYGGTAVDFAQCYDLIEACCDGFLSQF